MIKLMVVDDEPVIREGIETAVDWERLDIQVVGTAGNGRDGMAKALAQKPDIVITDIRMPVMDGIHFAKELKEKLPNVRIVFLTGYSEFEYAREAIRIGAAEYLLKPINTGELTELVGRLADEIRRENATVMNRNRETVLLKENLPMMRNRCVKRFFQGELGRGPFVERAGALGMELSGPQYQVIILCIDYYYQLIANGEREAGLLKYAMSNIAEEVLSASGRPVVCDEGEARLMVLLNTVEDTRGIARGCKEVQFCMRKYYGVSVSVGIGKKVGSLQELRQSYKAADEAVEARIKQGSSQIIVKDDETGNAADRTRLFLTPEEEQELSDAVKLLDKNRVYDALELIFEKYVMQQDIGRKGIEQLCMY
ncbi:MAG: response regulator, partial [Hungatella hathewayi]